MLGFLPAPYRDPRMSSEAISTPEIVAAIVFALAVLHTFSTKWFARLAHVQPGHAGLWHLLSEVEVVFGFWAFVLVIALVVLTGKTDAVDYMENRNIGMTINTAGVDDQFAVWGQSGVTRRSGLTVTRTARWKIGDKIRLWFYSEGDWETHPGRGQYLSIHWVTN